MEHLLVKELNIQLALVGTSACSPSLQKGSQPKCFTSLPNLSSLTRPPSSFRAMAMARSGLKNLPSQRGEDSA